MSFPQATLIPLLVILSFGLLLPDFFRKLRIPFVTSLILVGSMLGPNGLNYVQFDEIISFFGFLGMTFLMLMAGLDADIRKLKSLKGKMILLAAVNGLVPFLVGFGLTQLFGYSLTTSVIIGVVFMSSSVAILIPSLKTSGIFRKDVGQLILSAALIVDAASLVLLSVILQTISPVTQLPLLSYIFVLVLSMAALFYFVPLLSRKFFHRKPTPKRDYEKQLRFVIVIVMGVLVYFSALGVHPILAAFVIGLTLSNAVEHETIFTKLYTMGYGLFVPVFFFIVGMEMDLKLLLNFDATNVIIISIISGLIISKFLSGYMAGRAISLSSKDSAVFGVSSMIQLTTTLAVIYVASSLGILDSVLVTSIILLSIITTILGPVLLKILLPSS